MPTTGPCAACKAHRRKCTSDCVFAPLFPPDQHEKFTIIHNVYGRSNIAKLLQELPPSDRPGAIHSLVFEAECRQRDLVYGVVGSIFLLQQQLRQIDTELHHAKEMLASYEQSLNPNEAFTPQPQPDYYPLSNIMSPELGVVPLNNNLVQGLGTMGNNYSGFQVQPHLHVSSLPFQEQQLLIPAQQSSERQVLGLPPQWSQEHQQEVWSLPVQQQQGQGDQGSQKVMVPGVFDVKAAASCSKT